MNSTQGLGSPEDFPRVSVQPGLFLCLCSCARQMFGPSEDFLRGTGLEFGSAGVSLLVILRPGTFLYFQHTSSVRFCDFQSTLFRETACPGLVLRPRESPYMLVFGMNSFLVRNEHISRSE